MYNNLLKTRGPKGLKLSGQIMLILPNSSEFEEYRFTLSKIRLAASKFGTELDVFNISSGIQLEGC